MNQKSNLKIPQKIRVPTSRKDNPGLSRSSSASTLTSVTEVRSDAGDTAVEDAEEFAIGDRVWVNGTKPGFIQYIGETQFAPGVWAGVMLDDPIGKNDGSVAGVRYFSCEQKRGIFARPHRLTRQAGSPPKIGDISGNGTLTPATSKGNPGKTGTNLKGTNGSCSSGSITPSRTISSCSRLKVSERVVVNATSGVKIGTLRYLGVTDFAAGDWAGIELDEPLGKNDGSVAGKRYFDCKMKYGLFAPLHKVSRAGGTATPRQSSTGTSPLHHRSSSHESLNSSLSSSSAARAGRVKLGVTSLTSIQKATRSAAATVTATNAALQEALKEKEEHIEQLLKERDLERAEVARAASQVDEAEQKLSELQVEHQRYIEENEQRIIHMKELLEVSDNEYKKGTALLEEEKRKSEDLQFRVEEDTIAIGDLEAQIEKDRARIKELEEIVVKDKPLSEEPLDETNKFADYNLEITTYKEQITELIEKIKTLENQLKLYGTNEEISSETHEFREKLNISKQSLLLLETSVKEKDNEILGMQQKLSEFATKMDESNEYIRKQSEELKELQKKCISNEKLCEALSKENSLLQEQVANIKITENSEEIFDTSEQLKKKDKQIENLEAQLCIMKEELENIKTTTFAFQVQQKEEIEKLTVNHFEKMKIWQEKHDNLKSELEKVSSNAQVIAQSMEEKECRLENKEAELNGKCREVEEKQGQISELTALLEQSKLQVETLNEQKAADQNIFESKISKLQLELNNVLQEKNQNVQCITKEIKKLTQLLKEKDELQKEKENQMNALQKCVEDKAAQISILSSQLHNAEEKVKILCKENTDKYSLLQDAIAQAQAEKEIVLKENKESYELEIGRLSQITNEKDNNILEKEAIITTLTAKVGEQETELKEIKNRVKEMKLEQENLTKENKSANDELGKKLAQVEMDCQQLIKEKDMSLEAATNEMERLNTMLKEKGKELEEIEISRKGFQKTIEDRESEILQLNLKVEEMKQEVQKVNQQSSETSSHLQKEISEFKTQLENLEKEKDEEKEEMLSNLLKEKEQTTEEKQVEITNLKMKIKEQDSEITSLGLQLEEMRAKLEFQTKNGSSLRNEFESQILQLQAQCNKLLNEKDELSKQQKVFQETQKKLETQRDLLIEGKAEQEAIVSDREAKLALVQSEVNRMQAEFTKHKEELQQKLDVTETELQAMQELKKQLELQQDDLEELHKNLQNTENERLKLEQKVQSMNTIADDKIQLEKKLIVLQQQCEEATVKETDLEKKISMLEKHVENNQLLLTEKEKEIQAMNKQMESVQIEALESKTLKCALKSAEEEKELLAKKVMEFQTKVSDSNVNANLTESESGKQEKDGLLSQIDFLNSIIVDMQKKNEELTARVSILETGEVFGENDMNLNGIKTMVAPRLFCDICDMFDLHDTEDCPKQSSLDEEEMTHSRHHGSRSEPRPYCNNCEVFGHWTSDCDDQETF